MRLGGSTFLLFAFLCAGYVFLIALRRHAKFSISLTQGSIFFDSIALVIASVFSNILSYYVFKFLTKINIIEIGKSVDCILSNLGIVAGYSAVTMLVSYFFGAIIIVSINRRWLPIDMFYGPFYDLVTDSKSPFIKTSIITDSCVDERFLSYAGYLFDIRVTHTGKIDYIIIILPKRFYLKMNKGYSTTCSFRNVLEEQNDDSPSRLLIPGDRILNVLFDPINIKGIDVSAT